MAPSTTILVNAGAELRLDNVTLTGGASATSDQGAAITATGDVYLVDVDVVDNHATSTGPAILGNGGNIDISGGSVSDNITGGGAIKVYFPGDVTLDGVAIDNNVASEAGILNLWAGSGSITMTDTILDGNQSGERYGAISNFGGSQLVCNDGPGFNAGVRNHNNAAISIEIDSPNTRIDWTGCDLADVNGTLFFPLPPEATLRTLVRAEDQSFYCEWWSTFDFVTCFQGDGAVATLEDDAWRTTSGARLQRRGRSLPLRAKAPARYSRACTLRRPRPRLAQRRPPLLTILLALNAHAHDYLLAVDHPLRSSDPVVYGVVAHARTREPRRERPETLSRLEQVVRGQATPVAPREGSWGQVSVQPDAVTAVVYENTGATVELEWPRFRDYVAHEGDPRALHIIEGLKHEVQREQYRRSIKLLLGGAGAKSGWDQAVGLPLELVLLDKPGSSPMRLRLLENGAPVVGAKVRAYPYGGHSEEQAVSALTDQEGHVTLTLPPGERDWVYASVVMSHDATRKVPWQSVWTSLRVQ